MTAPSASVARGRHRCARPVTGARVELGPMSFTHKRRIAQTLSVGSVLLTGALLLSGCSNDDSESSKTDPQAAAASASPTSAFDQALAFSQCMRKNGVAGFPDPQQQANGGIALSPGGNVDPNSEGFKSAMESCRDKMPQGQLGGGGSGGGEPLDSGKVAAWAKCMRKNGLPNLPDPTINGGSMSIDFSSSGIDPGGADWSKARLACQSKWPGGALTGS